MDADAFEELVTGDLGSWLYWERSSKCPCVDVDGRADQACGVCAGLGRFYEEPVGPFRAGLVGQDARAFMRASGPGVVGDAKLILPPSAPCYREVGTGDRFIPTDPDDLEEVEWVLRPGRAIKVPSRSSITRAFIRNSTKDGLQEVVVAPGPGGMLQVVVPTTVFFRMPRRYEVVAGGTHVRSFGEGLPRTVQLVRVDFSVRTMR